MINGRIDTNVEVLLSTTEIARINALLERDEPKLAVKSDYGLKCPICDKHISPSDKFCDYCGQRIDTENVAL